MVAERWNTFSSIRQSPGTHQAHRTHHKPLMRSLPRFGWPAEPPPPSQRAASCPGLTKEHTVPLTWPPVIVHVALRGSKSHSWSSPFSAPGDHSDVPKLFSTSDLLNRWLQPQLPQASGAHASDFGSGHGHLGFLLAPKRLRTILEERILYRPHLLLHHHHQSIHSILWQLT